jgi:branched-chain amino acid aminotransferase
LCVFGTATAAIISSVSEIKYKDRKLIINKGEPDDLAVRLFNEITGIHYGLVPDKHNWLTPINIQINVE